MNQDTTIQNSHHKGSVLLMLPFKGSSSAAHATLTVPYLYFRVLCGTLPKARIHTQCCFSATFFCLVWMRTQHVRLQCAWSNSVLGRSCVFQQGAHVQQGVLHSPGEPGGVCLLAAVEGRDGDVDVLFHGVVTHSVAVGHHRTKAHHTISLGAHLKYTQICKIGVKSIYILYLSEVKDRHFQLLK